MSDTRPTFLFVTCQHGAENALKGELRREWPQFRLAYSRPGFVTFKLPADAKLADDFDLRSVFARAYGFSLGKVIGAAEQVAAGHWEAMASEAWKLAEGRSFDAVHVWERDRFTPGYRGFEPGPTELAAAVRDAVVECRARFGTCEPQPTNPCERQILSPTGTRGDAGRRKDLLPAGVAAMLAPALVDGRQADASVRGALYEPYSATSEPCGAPYEPRGASCESAPCGAVVLDYVIVEPHEWWIGYHRAKSWASRWPGGMQPVVLPEHAVSRAYLKMAEAIDWSGLPVRGGDLWAELGCAPGGASQAMLDRGLVVLGIDPAAVDPAVTSHPRFRHLRRRSKDVRRSEFSNVRVLVADMNVAPNYTLDAVEAIVTHPGVRIVGLLLTIKLTEWQLAAEIPAYLNRVRSWGFRNVRARHLQHNRQEICVMAQRR